MQSPAWHITTVNPHQPFIKKVLGKAGKPLAFLFLCVFLLLLFYQAAQVPTAHAQGTVTPGSETGELPGTKTLDAKQAADAGANAEQYRTFGCGIGKNATFDAAVCLSNVVYAFTVGLGSGLAYMGGFMFDITVSLSLNSAAYALDFLSGGWTMTRDLANMAFILILVYIAFTIMFQAETARTMQMLALVIFIALIINFSFFLTRVVIDAGNILAVQFYNAIDAQTLDKTIKATTSSTGALAGTAAGVTSLLSNGSLSNTKDLTYSIMQVLDIEKMFSTATFKQFVRESDFGSKFILLTFIYIGVGAAYFILAAMFFAVGIKFLVRIVILWLLIVASPLAFVAKAIPGRSDISAWYDTWQTNLFSHAFYPAFFLLIFLFISTVLQGLSSDGNILQSLAGDLQKLGSDQSLGGFVFIATSLANVAIRLGFVVALLYAALKASEHLGVQGANLASKATSFAFGQTGRLASAPVGWMGRRTLGWTGNKMVDTSKKFENRALLASNALSKAGWRGLRNVTGVPGEKLGKASYDPRNAPGASILKKGVERITGGSVNAGKPPEGGFMAQAKERAERIKKERDQRAKLIKERENEEILKELAEKSARHDALDAAGTSGALTATERAEKRALKTEVEKLANKFNNVSKGEVDSLKLADIEKVLKHAKEGIIKKVEESDKHSDKAAGLREKWEDASLSRSQDLIKGLERIHKDLTTRGQTGTPAGTLQLHTLATTVSPGTLIDKDQVADTLKEVKKELQLAKGRLNAASSAGNTADIDREKETLEQLQEARDYIAQVEMSRKGVPSGKGGAPGAEEFLVA